MFLCLYIYIYIFYDYEIFYIMYTHKLLFELVVKIYYYTHIITQKFI